MLQCFVKNFFSCNWSFPCCSFCLLHLVLFCAPQEEHAVNIHYQRVFLISNISRKIFSFLQYPIKCVLVGEERRKMVRAIQYFFFFFKVPFPLRITKAILQKKNKCASGNVTSLLRSIFANVGIENLWILNYMTCSKSQKKLTKPIQYSS